jgi:CheY-like chemotaxis protein
LIVDDVAGDRVLLTEILKKEVGEMVCADSIKLANEIVEHSLRTGNLFDIALVDLNMSIVDDGSEFARRLMDIVGTRVVIVTGNIDPMMELPFEPDGKVVKEVDMHLTANTLTESVRQLLLEPRRRVRYPRDSQINRWIATGYMTGILGDKYITREFTGQSRKRLIEKWTLCTSDRHLLTCLVLPRRSRDRVVSCSVQTTIGCDQMCPSCTYWRIREKGPTSCLVRALSLEEIQTQVYQMIMGSQSFDDAFLDSSELGVDLYFTGEGDGLVNNLASCANVIWQLAEIEKPQFSFIFHTVGNERSLGEYIKECIDLPRTTLAWSFYSPIKKTRELLIPGSRGCSIEVLAELWGVIVNQTGRKVDASIPLFSGVNNSREDAREVAVFFGDRPFFRPVLIAAAALWGTLAV